MKWLIALAAGTFASEDLTCISAGQLVRVGYLSPVTALLGCFLGIYLGDLALWLGGRLLGRRILALPLVGSRINPDHVEHLSRWFDGRSGTAILASRFLPGTRLPMYVAAGALGRRKLAFFGWTFLAAILWTPLVVLTVALLGDAVVRPLQKLFGHSLIVAAIVALIAMLVLRLPRLIARHNLHYKILASISKLWRYEFWPMGLFYALWLHTWRFSPFAIAAFV